MSPKETWRDREPVIDRIISFAQAVAEICPQTAGTGSVEIVSRLIWPLQNIVERDKGICITESGALILYCPSEKGKKVPAVAQKVISACIGRESEIDQTVHQTIKDLSEGPDLDIKYAFDPRTILAALAGDGNQYSDLAKNQLYGELLIPEETSPTGETVYNCRKFGFKVVSRITKIPVYSSNLSDSYWQRQFLEWRIFDGDGKQTLKVHLTSFPMSNQIPTETVYKADCRYGLFTSDKNHALVAPVIFPTSTEPVGGNINVLTYRGFKKALLGAQDSLFCDCYHYSTKELEQEIFYSSGGVFLIGMIRMLNMAILTQNAADILAGKVCLSRPTHPSLREVVDYLNQNREGFLFIHQQAKPEIISTFLLGCFLDSRLFLYMAESFGLWDLLAGEKAKVGELGATVEEIKKADPKTVVEAINRFASFFPWPTEYVKKGNFKGLF